MKIEDIIHKTRGHVMCRRIKEASFDEWLAYLFDRPECEYGSHWCFDDDKLEWDIPRELSAEFIIRTYEDPAFWLHRFSNAQIAAGLEFTWNPAFGDVYATISHEPTPTALRQRAVRALIPLYRDCFEKRCSRGLSNLNEASDNQLNGACYMYWDVCPFIAEPEKPNLRFVDQECLNVLESTLQIDHDACRESALHGLGHWEFGYPERVKAVVSDWLLKQGTGCRPELVQYAMAAACGNVQ